LWEPPRVGGGKLDNQALAALGNAVSPRCAEVVGMVVLQIDRALREGGAA
jgi:hypothetical protein